MQIAERLQRFQPTIELLAVRWGSAGPLLPGFALLAQGKPVPVEEIAEASGIEIESVERAVSAARCERDPQGRLIDLYGMALAPAPHRIEIRDKTLFSCCALWAHVIPKLVDTTVQVESVDPMRKELVRLSVSPSGVESVDHPGAAATLAVATQENDRRRRLPSLLLPSASLRLTRECRGVRGRKAHMSRRRALGARGSRRAVAPSHLERRRRMISSRSSKSAVGAAAVGVGAAALATADEGK